MGSTPREIKRLARARQKAKGERYTTALMHTRNALERLEGEGLSHNAAVRQLEARWLVRGAR